MKRIKIISFLLIIAINFTSCSTHYKIYYGDDFSSLMNQIDLGVNIFIPPYDDYWYPFFTFTIYGYQEDTYHTDDQEHTYPSIRSITVDEMKIITKNATYDMKRYIYEIQFMEDVYGKRNLHRLTNLEDFYNTSSISAPSNEWFQGVEFYGKNPGLKYLANPKITVLLNIKIELEDGTIKQIKKERKAEIELDGLTFQIP